MNDQRQLRILIVKLSSLGDIIHALPAPCSLRATYPQARIAWVVEKKWLPLIERHPDLDEVFTVDSFRLRGAWHTYPEFLADLRKLRGFRPDWAIDLQGTVKSAVLTRLTGAPMRAGFALPVVREGLTTFFYNHPVTPQSAHVVEQIQDVIEAIGPLHRDLRFPFPIPESDRQDVDAWLRQNGIGKFVFISPGGGWASKRWPSQRYGELAERLEQQYGIVAVINRGPGEKELDEAFRRANVIRARLFSGGVLRLAAVLERASLVVGGDTGPLHLGAVLGAPVVALFGPTDPARNGPWSQQAIVLRKQSPVTYKRGNHYSPGMLAISVDEVLEACGRLLAPAGRKASE